MADQKIDLNDKVIARLPYAETGQYRVRDSALKGFFVLIGKHSKTFMVQGEYWKNGVRVFSARTKVSEFGETSYREAKVVAKEALAAIAKGKRPGSEPESTMAPITLRQAWDRYRVAHMERKGRNERTIANYRDHMERLFKDWLDAPLAQLGEKPALVVDRHDSITKENGPYIANGSMRSLRAIYNHAVKANRDLPPVNPVTAIDWNKEKRRDTGIGSDDVVGWLGELHALPNALRREFHLMTMLSGSRPTALKNIRIDDINLRDRLLHIPKPKGGEDKAFDIPLSRPIIRCILRAMRIGRTFFPAESATWLFPAESESGHLEEHKEDRSDLSKWGNDLRQTYRNLAQVAGVGESDIHLLMNHALPGVNGGYLTRDRLTRNHLRAQQERISSIAIEQVEKAKAGALLAWLTRTKIDDQATHTTKRTGKTAMSQRSRKTPTAEQLTQAAAS